MGGTIIPKYISDLAKQIILYRKEKMEKEKEYTSTNKSTYNPKLVDIYEVLKTEIINSLVAGQYKIVDEWNNIYKLRLGLADGLDLDIIVSESKNIDIGTITSLKIESNIKPYLPFGINNDIVKQLKSKRRESEIVELEEKISKLQDQINDLKQK